MSQYKFIFQFNLFLCFAFSIFAINAQAISTTNSCDKLFPAVQNSKPNSFNTVNKSNVSSGSDVQSASYSKYVNFEINEKQMLQLHGTSGYDSKTISLFFRELIQNSVDAVRQQKSNLSVKPEGISAVIGDIKNIFGKKENPAETYKPQVNVFVDPSKRWMAIEDNGIGMDENTIIKGFLTLGGSMKGETASSGALGLAKGAFISGSKRIFVSTIHDGIKYEFLVDSLKLKADPKTKIKIDSSKAKGQPNGTIVAIELLDVPSFARSAEEWGNHDFPYLENIPVNFFNTNLNENFENIPAEIANYKATSSDKPTPFFKKIKTQGPSIINDRMHFDNWGEVEIIISKEKTSFGKHQVLSNGIFQFTETIRDSQNKPLPYNILINIKPNIKADNPNYPFNNTRDGIRPSVKDDYKKVIDRVQQHVNKIEDERVLKELEGLVPLEQVSIAEKYEKIKNEQTKPRVFFDDETDANIQEEIEETKYNNLNIQPGKPVLNNRTTLDFNGIEEDSMILLSKLSAISEHVRTHMIELGLSSGDSDFINLALALKKYQVGILIAKNIHGVNYKGRFNAVLVNPLTLKRGSDGDQISENIYVTIVHELTHATRLGHDEFFTILHDKIFPLLASEGYNATIRSLILEVLLEHKATFTELRKRFNSSQNISQVDPLSW